MSYGAMDTRISVPTTSKGDRLRRPAKREQLTVVRGAGSTSDASRACIQSEIEVNCQAKLTWRFKM